MDRARWKVSGFVTALTLLAACGGGASSDPGGGTPGGTGPDTVALFCDQLYTSFAERYAACYKAPLAYATHFIDKAKLCAPPVAAVAAGKAVYDQAAAGRCLDAYATASCTQLRAVREETIDLPDCRAAVVGTVRSAYACKSDAECVSGICPASAAWDCNATYNCTTGIAAGQGQCWSDRDCAAGTYCYTGTVLPYQTCQPASSRPGDGESCSGVQCQPGFYCTAVSGGTCNRQIDAGACPGGSNAMVPGYGCFAGVTRALANLGAPCASSFECGPGAYCAWSVSAGANVCTQLPVVGQPCVQSRGAWECLGGTCNGAVPTPSCVEYIPASCGSVWDCESVGYCDGACEPFCVTP
jgi:hypothetical protein